MKSSVGLFLGAGASYEAGMPLVWELTTELKDWLTTSKLKELSVGWKSQGDGFPDTVIEDLASVLVRSDMHYEAVLGHLETIFLHNHHGHGQHYHHLYSWLVQMVYAILYIRHIKNKDFFDRHLLHYDGIKSFTSSSETLWVFSLNHDLVLEMIAARLSIPLYSGYDSLAINLPLRNITGEKIGEIRGEVITGDQLTKQGLIYPNPPVPGIYLMKIHGALDIFTFNDGKNLLKLLPNSSDPYAYLSTLQAANEQLVYPIAGTSNGKVNTTNEIAYADHDGEMRFLRRSLLAGAYKFDARSQQVLPKSMLIQFKTHLNWVTELICIGYSWGDLHINAVIREWLEFSSERRLEIVDPFVNGVPPIFAHLCPQVTITKEGATDFLDIRSNIKRSPREKIEKQVANVLRKRGRSRAARDVAAFVERMRAKLRASPSVVETGISAENDLQSADGPQPITDRKDLNEDAMQVKILSEMLTHLNHTKQF